jgi:transposase
LTLTEERRIDNFLELLDKIKKSKLSTKEYFATHQTSIGLRHYFRLKKRLQKEGTDGLFDQRCHGNASKLTKEQKQMVQSIFAYNRHLTSGELQDEMENKWEIKLGTKRIDQLRRQFNLTRIRSNSTREEIVQFAGIEIFTALVHYIGIMDHWNDTIQKRLQQVKETIGNGGRGDHIYARHRNGTFTPRYNRLSHVRTMKFASITDKAKKKDFSRLSLYNRSASNLSQKNLAVLLLPLVTNNGATRSLDKPMGNALEYACGYNYKNATIDKYLRELKYLQVSEDLINCNARFWSHFWKQYDCPEHKIGCYYIDGNVKPLWSLKRCRKGKVTMLGRVMGCLEQVVIHDGYGRPIYFQTFSGNADLQHNALHTMEHLDELLNEGQKPRSKKPSCMSALIIDGAGNAVQTLRAFSKSDYHYITILDTNQINPRKFKHRCPPERYQHGEAFLTDSLIEMIDSKEKGYIYESRAVHIHWDNGKESCLVTSIGSDLLDASGVVKTYFDRWPFCEKQFAMLKAAACFHRVVGYGKKLVPDENMLSKIQKLQTDLQRLRDELSIPLSQIAVKDEKLCALFDKERKLKEQSKVKEGKRIQSSQNQKDLQSTQRDIRRIQREIKKIEEPFKKQFSSLREKSKEFARIQGKREVYHVDVELDQLLTSYRLTLANIIVFFVKVILGGIATEMNTLIQSILFLSGSIYQ